VTRVALIGPGRLGADLLEKLRRSPSLEVVLVAGQRRSPGLVRAESYGIPVTTDGIEGLFARREEVDLVFDATTPRTHGLLAREAALAGLRLVNLTPARTEHPLVPILSPDPPAEEPVLGVATASAQATAPLVAALAQVAPVAYAETVSTLPSRSVGPGFRASIDEFTSETGRALEVVGGAGRGKGIIILSPAEPPIAMRNTLVCLLPADADRAALEQSARRMEASAQALVPGFRIGAGPLFEEHRDDEMKVSFVLEVRGAGDSLFPEAGNLDLAATAAIAVAERIAQAEASGR
jgi:acetaldehyde dehydrogenase